MALIDEDDERVYLFMKCQLCNDEMVIPVRKTVINSAKRYPVPVVYVHGEPLHTLLIYVDHEFTLRGWEVIPAIEFSTEITLVFNKRPRKADLDPSLMIMKIGVQNYSKLSKTEKQALTEPLKLKTDENGVNKQMLTHEIGISNEDVDEFVRLFEGGKTLFDAIELLGFDQTMPLYRHLTNNKW